RDEMNLDESEFLDASLRLQEHDNQKTAFLQDTMRRLDITDLSDRAALESARRSKLRQFLDLIPMPAPSSWMAFVSLYGEALGIDPDTISLAIADRRASAPSEKPSAAQTKMPARHDRKWQSIFSPLHTDAGPRATLFQIPPAQCFPASRDLPIQPDLS